MKDKQWQFKEIDSSLFKAFLFAARELNFTRAAQMAAMTQSGVSQKIAKLEEQVGQPLFLRVNKSVSLTETGQILLDYIERQQDELEKLFEDFGKGTQSINGLVRYGMPHSCLFTPHFPLLLKAREKFQGVQLRVELCPNEDVIEKLLRRELDFGFLTRRSENPAVEHVPFAVEEYALIGKKSARGIKATPDFIKELPFVNYPGMRNLFEIWKNGHFPSSRALNFESISIAGEINSLHGAVTMISHGIGWSVVPTHVIAKELEDGEVQIMPGTDKKKIKSEIFIVSLKGNKQPARVKTVMEAFFKMKKGEILSKVCAQTLQVASKANYQESTSLKANKLFWYLAWRNLKGLRNFVNISFTIIRDIEEGFLGDSVSKCSRGSVHRGKLAMKREEVAARIAKMHKSHTALVSDANVFAI